MSEVLTLATLQCRPLRLGALAPRVAESAARAGQGRLLGLWRSEFGPVGDLLMLRAFADADAAAQSKPDPAALGPDCLSAHSVMFRRFPFLPPVDAPRYRGRIYEIRDYQLQPEGLAPTLAAWEAALAGAGSYGRHLVTAMASVDGSARIVHIWAFHSLDQRARLRRAAFAAGIWPPKGAPERIARARSTVALADPLSPLG